MSKHQGTGFGLLAESVGIRLPLQVLKSRADYYIGTFSLDMGPVSRESIEYFENELLAQNALTSGNWTQRRDH